MKTAKKVPNGRRRIPATSLSASATIWPAIRTPVEVIRSLFPLRVVGTDFFSTRTLADKIHQHMVHNVGDWSVEFLFEQIGAMTCSRDRFARLVRSVGRGDPEQTALVDSINLVLRRDGYVLRSVAEESGYALPGSRHIVVNPTAGKGDVAAEVDGVGLVAECKGSIINTRHPGRVSRLYKGLCKTVGLLTANPCPGRQIAVVPRSGTACDWRSARTCRSARPFRRLHGRL
jgi:hypothetical protein